ncbi:MAG: S8 family serine peptidase [Defluviicoccus sp.]|nr:S8 family serine peptidase [Defluviicoccus sp.]MDE0276421.1 S8 family serine peptidase [Defluviicoccus sp.]
MRNRGAALALAAALALPNGSIADGNDSEARWLRLAVERLCPQPGLSGLDAQDAIPGSWLLDETRRPDDRDPRRIAVRLLLPGADRLTVERRQFRGRLRQFRVAYAVRDGDRLRPSFQAIADGGCTVRSGRAIRAEGDAWRYLDQLEGDLETLKWTETLQAPWPVGVDPGGVRVALVDSGLAYDLPPFRDRLARDGEGKPLGYDYWDLDPWPYDGDVSRGPFLPIRHGTAVASILAREAPDAALVPFRYPRPDMSRMGELVARAVQAGVRILAMPLGSRKPEDWRAFERALRGRDILAIVSAGNDGRDIDREPVYPAALALENIVTVTSADAFGRLASGSNWGAETVDVMLPAENLEIVDFRGASGKASGSSYAVPRLAALAARILARHPGLGAAELKARVLARATPSPFERKDVVSAGWIPDPLSD